jgi:cytochrome oxidase assembly protein ShyY1
MTGVPTGPFSILSLIFLASLLMCAWLGLWQVQRMHEKQDLIDRFEHAENLGLQQAIDQGRLYSHVMVTGHYDRDWHLLLDNKVLNGRVGVHALTLFVPDLGKPILVDRGWLPLPPDRSSLPEIPTPPGNLSISGILNQPAADGIRLGNPDNLQKLSGPRLITYLDLGNLASVLNGDLSQWLIQLDASDPSGFAGRDWEPTVMKPEQHGAYAVQWFSAALIIAIVWLRLMWKSRRRQQDRSQNLA